MQNPLKRLSRAQRPGQFQQLLKTHMILILNFMRILNFTRIHCDSLVNNIEGKITEFLNALDCDNRWSTTSFSYSSKFDCNFLPFAHFLKTFSHHSVLFFVFSFLLLSYIFLVSYLETRRKTSLLNKPLLGNLRTNRERVILT